MPVAEEAPHGANNRNTTQLIGSSPAKEAAAATVDSSSHHLHVHEVQKNGKMEGGQQKCHLQITRKHLCVTRSRGLL